MVTARILCSISGFLAKARFLQLLGSDFAPRPTHRHPSGLRDTPIAVRDRFIVNVGDVLVPSKLGKAAVHHSAPLKGVSFRRHWM